VDASELMSIGSAAQRLGVTRPTIYRWMDDHTLNYVRDEMSGRTFVFRQDVDLLHEEASHMSHDQILPRSDDGYDRLERDAIQ
jgi:excisionase family DNA binding protein